ncbi:hypothetical protein ABPG74_013804 [Tetrahymena malaccensis]
MKAKAPLSSISMNQQLPPRSLSQVQDKQGQQKSKLSLTDALKTTNSSKINNKENLIQSTTCVTNTTINESQSRRSLSISGSNHNISQNSCSNTSSLLKQNNMSQALKQSQLYTKQSIIYKCLKQGLDDLVCEKHSNQEYNYFCSTCKTLLCHYCLNSDMSSSEEIDHSDHWFLNIHQFMDYPVLSFLENNKLLCEIVSQSQFLFQKIKDQTECSKKVLKEYLNSLMQWMQKQIAQIQDTFDKQISLKLDGIQKQIDFIQEISSIYKNEWDNWIGSNDIQSKQDLEDLCKKFIENSDDPQQSIKHNYEVLNDILKSIPELNIQGFKDLYFRMTDSFRFSYDYLITPKMTQNNNQSNMLQGFKQTKVQTPDSLIQLQKSIESIQRQYSNLEVISDFSSNEAFKIQNIIPLCEGESDKILAIGSDSPIVKFISVSKKRCLNTLIRNENEQINNIIPLKDKKHIALCTNNYFELFSLQTGKAIYRDKMNCIQACEIPSSRILVADTNNMLYVYSFENLKNVQKVATLNPNIFASAIDFTIIPSDIVIPNSRQSLGDQEIIAISDNNFYSSQYSTNQSNKQKCVIQLWDIQSLQLIKFLQCPQLNSGILKLKFLKMSDKEKNLHHLLLALTNDSKILVWNYITQNQPSAIINLIPGEQNQTQYNSTNSFKSVNSSKSNPQLLQQSLNVQNFDLLDDDKIIYSLGSTILIASICQAKVLGCFCHDSIDGTTQTCQYENFYDFDQLQNISNQYKSTQNGKSCSQFTSLLLLGKNSQAEPFILASKYNPQTKKSQIESFKK